MVREVQAEYYIYSVCRRGKGEEIQEKFKKFLKEKHCLEEFNYELVAYSNYEHCIHEMEYNIKSGVYKIERLLEDGYLFDYKTAVTCVDWREVNREWIKILEEG